MTIRAGILGVLLGIGLGTGCTHAGGKVPVDIPPLAYQAPDIDEITGIDSDDEAATEQATPAAAPAPAPAPKAPAPKK